MKGLRLLRIFCPSHLLEEIEGDLLQRFERDVNTHGESKARRKLLWNMLRFFRPEIIARNRFSTTSNYSVMWRHYFITLLRNAGRNKMSSGLNLAGLVVGIAGALAMALFIEGELTFDKFDQSSNVYRVVFGSDDNSGSAHTPHVMGTTLKNNYPGVTPVRFNNAGNARVNFKHGDTQFMETAFYFTDPEVLQVFPFKLTEGSPVTCLVEPFTMVITQRAAHKFFGDENPLGRMISINWIDKDYELKITGLVDERDYHSHISFDYLISMATAERLFQPQSFFTDWTANFNVTYLKIENPQTAALIDKDLTSLYRTNTRETSDQTHLRLQPFDRIHLYSHLAREIGSNSDIKYVYVATCIGVLILLVSLINYTNLTSALYTLRLKEIGVRKSLGAGRYTIVGQFLGEFLIHISFSLIVALGLLAILAPLLSEFLGTSWTFGQLLRVPGVWYCILAIMVTGITSGIYPSLLLSRRDAGEVLYGRTRIVLRSSWIKNSLVGFQLFIALFILTSSLVVRKQLNYIRQKDLGYDKEMMLTLPHGRAIRERTELVKREMMQTGQILSTTLSSQLPTRGLGFKVPAIVEGGNPDGSNEPWPVAIVSVDFDFFETFGLEVKEGRTFSTQFPTDSTEGFVLNEAAVRALNWTSPIGKEMQMTYNAGDGTVETHKGRVIGVINDFNFESLHRNIEPIVFLFKPFWFYYITFKLAPGQTLQSLDQLSNKWKALVPEAPFEYVFMTDRIEQLYATERAWGAGIDLFSIIAMGISGVGLLGLISFLVQSRMREIAVRKVLGAESRSIFFRFYSSILALVILAALGAAPAAWFASEVWLSDFAYRIAVGADVFAVALVLVVAATSLAVFSQIFKASRVNPVEILKCE